MKDKIKIKKEKKVSIGMFGIKPDKIEIFYKVLNKMILTNHFVNSTEKDLLPKITIMKINQTKETLLKFQTNSITSKDLDILFIIHKVEGRIFLLGRNGFYNSVCEKMLSTLHGNICFFLLYKNIYDEKFDHDEIYTNKFQFQYESISNLIHKGEQKELQSFQNENKIFCFDDDQLEKDLTRRNEYFEAQFYGRYFIYSLPKLNSDSIEFSVNLSNEDYLLIDQLHLKLLAVTDESEENRLKNKFKCFML